VTAAGGVSITIPALRVPFDAYAGQAWIARAMAANVGWTREAGLLPDDEYAALFAADALGELTARAFVCADPDMLDLIAAWEGWYFAWDDPLDDVPPARRPEYADALVNAAVDVMRAPPQAAPAGAQPGVRGLAQLWQRTWDVAPGSSFCHRYAMYMIRFLRAYQRQARVGATGEVMAPTYFADYHRLDSAGALMSAHLIEPAARMTLSDRALANLPQIQGLYEAGGQAIGWLNDLYSAGKEAAVGDRCNYVTVLHHHTGASYQDCAQRIADRIQDKIDLFEVLLGELHRSAPHVGLPDGEAEDVTAWGRRLAYWVRGHADWHACSPRYQPDRVTALTERIGAHR
jgi:hypothetical protein